MRHEKSTISKIIITITLLCSLSISVQAGTENWKLKRNENGIKVFTANVENSSFKSARVEFTVNARLSQFVAFLFDIGKQHDWIYGNKFSTLVKMIGANELVFYSEVTLPWPCANRDYIAHITVKQKSPNLVTIDSHAEPDLLPGKEGKVRVRSSVTHWDVTALSKEQLYVVYTVQFDPAGSVPAWLVNLFIAKGPYQTFYKLREEINKPNYKNARVDFIKDYL